MDIRLEHKLKVKQHIKCVSHKRLVRKKNKLKYKLKDSGKLFSLYFTANQLHTEKTVDRENLHLRVHILFYLQIWPDVFIILSFLLLMRKMATV